MDNKPDSSLLDAPDRAPSILDWLKSLLRGKPMTIPLPEEDHAFVERVTVERPQESRPEASRFSPRRNLLRLPSALLLAWVAQIGLEQRGEMIGLSIVLYIAAAFLMGWGAYAGDFSFSIPDVQTREAGPLVFRTRPLAAAFLFGAIAFISSGGNTFNFLNLTSWILSIIFLVSAFWEGELPWQRAWGSIRAFFNQPQLSIQLRGWHILWLIVFGVGIYFRFHEWHIVPNAMVSDHTEKLLDVVDVLNGRFSIFFPRNTGREALQFYMAAATERLLGTGISFETLKFGTIIAGIITLPYIYLFARETAGKEVGLAAMGLAGIAYWPNVISRVGLRFPLYPLFAAPALYYLVRGLRRKERNDFILCGLFVGLGLHGYSPARVIPIAVAAGVIIYILHRQAKGTRWAAVTWLIAAGFTALLVFVPLLRIFVAQPDAILFRMATRMGDAERPLPGSALGIFLKNVWDGLLMFSWDDGEIWVNSIPHRPAFDWITAGLFNLGIVTLAVRYIRKRSWLDLFILLSIPILQLPSTLSLAFPGENPATNRASGAIVPAFTAAGMGLMAIYSWIQKQWKTRRAAWSGAAIVTILFFGAAGLNYKLVFTDYADLFRRSAWNTQDAGRIIRGFAESIGDYESAYIMAYPYWMDTRLVGIEAGKPTRDYALWPDQLDSILPITTPHLFLLNPQDEESLSRLEELFPQGELTIFDSELEGKDILIYFTLPTSSLQEQD